MFLPINKKHQAGLYKICKWGYENNEENITLKILLFFINIQTEKC